MMLAAPNCMKHYIEKCLVGAYLSPRMVNMTKVASKAPENQYWEVCGFYLHFLSEFSLTQSPITIKPFL